MQFAFTERDPVGVPKAFQAEIEEYNPHWEVGAFTSAWTMLYKGTDWAQVGWTKSGSGRAAFAQWTDGLGDWDDEWFPAAPVGTSPLYETTYVPGTSPKFLFKRDNAVLWQTSAKFVPQIAAISGEINNRANQMPGGVTASVWFEEVHYTTGSGWLNINTPPPQQRLEQLRHSQSHRGVLRNLGQEMQYLTHIGQIGVLSRTRLGRRPLLLSAALLGLVVLVTNAPDATSVGAGSFVPAERLARHGIDMNVLPLAAAAPEVSAAAAREIAKQTLETTAEPDETWRVFASESYIGTKHTAWLFLFQGGSGPVSNGPPTGADRRKFTTSFTGVLVDDRTGAVMRWFSGGSYTQ